MTCHPPRRDTQGKSPLGEEKAEVRSGSAKSKVPVRLRVGIRAMGLSAGKGSGPDTLGVVNVSFIESCEHRGTKAGSAERREES